MTLLLQYNTATCSQYVFDLICRHIRQQKIEVMKKRMQLPLCLVSRTNNNKTFRKNNTNIIRENKINDS